MISLAVKYRPKTWGDVTEQDSVKTILENQMKTNTIKHGYLFCGGAGTGKTTCARIFANEINHHQGEPIELDAASNNSVEDIRRITDQANKKSLDSEYKVFILDEVHSLSNQAWQAFLKTLEEPPAKSIFILCTTNPEKIPNTILSRVQRYNFKRISQKGVVERLAWILERENNDDYDLRALDYIAKIADGGMRDAITLMDKCLSYSDYLDVNSVISALGVADYETMFNLIASITRADDKQIIKIVNDVYSSGVDLKLFIKNFFEFVLDLRVLDLTGDYSLVKIPSNWAAVLDKWEDCDWDTAGIILEDIVNLQSEIKWASNVKSVVVARLLLISEKRYKCEK